MKESLKKPTFGGYAHLFETFEGIYGRLKYSPDPFLLLETSVFRCIASHDIKVAKNFPEDEKNGAVATRNTPKKEEKIDIPQSVQKTEEKASEEKPTTAFDFSRFVEHIRTVPKRSFV